MHSASAPSALPSVPSGASVRLAVKEISKTFPGVVANDRVTLDVRRGEVHALLGENGAGKTTLMNILYGIYQPDAGEIVIDGREVRVRSPRDAIAHGVGMVPQHFLLVRRHTVAENVALGLSGTRFLLPVRGVEMQINAFADRYGLRVDPHAAVWHLSISEQQRVEILKALLRGAEILILDEPTSVLTPQEATQLFGVLRRMKEEGKSVIFITHKLDEVLAAADRVTVMRKGRVIDTVPVGMASKPQLARMMVGHDVDFQLPARRPGTGAPALVVEDLWVQGDRGLPVVRGVSFVLHRQEILGIAGVAGNGQRELVEALTGLRRVERGRVTALDRDVSRWSPRTMSKMGVAHIPEERIRMGIVPPMSVTENAILRRYEEPPFSRGPLMDYVSATRFAQQLIVEYSIQTPSPRTPARLLSGGNIQKLILARELSHRPDLIIAAHPTYGLDVSTTDRIHRLLLQRRDDCAAVLLVSEDLDEIRALADRIGVMYGGELVAVVPAGTDRETVGLLMAGQRV
ncbi:MAG: ABC transporter ATP-binding protein [Bacillati bacterium ANGP1]|uniref:ABC transporter ATP-binding protein n=1 Tax=Candidatus Segetimicrobium genomatis TaxID=2569760 RepID=A0A537LB98_9BACT|nr:MAG: ABC transporter ATP-binding protein [Terrabacteria group bacterium ANGP1]